MTIDNVERSSQRYVPSGCAMLSFHRGDRIYSTLHQEIQPCSSLCGQSVLYTDTVYSGNLNLVMVVFQSVAARVIFDIPMIDTNFHPHVIDELDAQNNFEYIIVATNKIQLPDVLPILGASAGKAHVLFFQNNWDCFDEIARYLKPE